MSVPFSNAHFHVPRGFGDLLEGLAREVLRDQPKDIPAFAALYFNRLLKEREESSMDPAEWGARDDDRYYNYTFKVITLIIFISLPTFFRKKEPESLEKCNTEIIVPVQVSTVSSANFEIFEEVSGVDTEPSTVNDSDDRITLVSRSDGDIASVDAHAVELKEHEEGIASIDICTEDGGTANVDICAEELKDPEGAMANVDICAEEQRDLEEQKVKTNTFFEGTEGESHPNVQAQAKEETLTLITEPKGDPQKQVTEEHTPTVEAEGGPEENMSETADRSNQELIPEEDTMNAINPENENNQEVKQLF
ncbi:sperm surface protein Sp17 [Arapaima gigas]